MHGVNLSAQITSPALRNFVLRWLPLGRMEHFVEKPSSANERDKCDEVDSQLDKNSHVRMLARSDHLQQLPESPVSLNSRHAPLR
jgi:hypothetical protein